LGENGSSQQINIPGFDNNVISQLDRNLICAQTLYQYQHGAYTPAEYAERVFDGRYHGAAEFSDGLSGDWSKFHLL